MGYVVCQKCLCGLAEQEKDGTIACPECGTVFALIEVGNYEKN